MGLKKILVIGGGGYIGSNMLLALEAAAAPTIVLDNFSTGYRDAVRWGELVEGDVADAALLDRVFLEHEVSAVVHFASFIQVAESVSRPDKYYANNVANTITLLNAMVKHGVKHIVFSSSAAVYGAPSYVPIDESHAKAPLHAYGRSKLIVEEILRDYDAAFGLKSVCLRYFNAAGADPLCRAGERHVPETHLIPLAIRAAISGERLSVYGRDYPTKDGTCIRDYVHVTDLCSAHVLALEFLSSDHTSVCLNLGAGEGHSVLDIAAAVQSALDRPVELDFRERRSGDPPVLVADATRAQKTLGWTPKFPNLKLMVSHAAAWEQHLSQQPL